MTHLDLMLLLSVGVVFSWYAIGLTREFHNKGLDPTRVTYLSPLLIYKHNIVRMILVFMFATEFIYPSAATLVYLLAGLLMSFALVQMILVLAFGRTGTQPFLYYVFQSVGGLLLILFASSNVISSFILIFMVIAGDVLLAIFRRNRVKKYNTWVSKKVCYIHNKYAHLSKELDYKEWFYTLHFAVTESIARPRLSRFGEYLYFKLKRPAYITSGIMQVKSETYLSDSESIVRGSEIVSRLLRKIPTSIQDPLEQLRWLAQQYNGSIDAKANADYTGYLLLTYPGLLLAWEEISK